MHRRRAESLNPLAGKTDLIHGTGPIGPSVDRPFRLA